MIIGNGLFMSGFMGGKFSPLQLPTLALWKDGADVSTMFTDGAGTTPVTADGDVVGKFLDKSGNGRHTTQATTSKKGLYKVNIQNGLSVVKFDAVDDVLSGTGFDLPDFSVFVVFSLPSAAKGGFAGPLAIVGTNTGFKFVSTSSTTAYRRRVALFSSGSEEANNYHNTSDLTLPVATHLYTWQRASGNAPTLRQDAASISLITTTPGFAGASIYHINSYNGTAAFGMNLCELIVCSSVLPALTVSLVETYLNSKWGIY